VLLLEPLVDPVVDRLGLAVRVARADDEVVRVAEHAAQVELDDVDRLHVGGEVLDDRGELGAVEGGLGLLAHR
jgi:hypothetical protein